jgi:hypothetical protein
VVDRVETHESRSGAENVATFRMNVGSRDQSWGEGSLESLTSDVTDAGTVQVVELRYQQGGSKGSRSGRGGGGGGGCSLVGVSSDSEDYNALDGLCMDLHDDSWGGGTDSTTTATDMDGGGEGGGYAHITSARGVRVAGGGKNKTHTTRHHRKQHQHHEKTASLYAPAVEADMDALVMSSDSGGDEVPPVPTIVGGSSRIVPTKLIICSRGRTPTNYVSELPLSIGNMHSACVSKQNRLANYLLRHTPLTNTRAPFAQFCL